MTHFRNGSSWRGRVLGRIHCYIVRRSTTCVAVWRREFRVRSHHGVSVRNSRGGDTRSGSRLALRDEGRLEVSLPLFTLLTLKLTRMDLSMINELSRACSHLLTRRALANTGRMICMHIGGQMSYLSPRSAKEGITFLAYSSGGIAEGEHKSSKYCSRTPCVYG